MTQEQFIIYLYGIYPEGGLSFFAVGMLLAFFGLRTVVWIYREENDGDFDTPYETYIKPVKVAGFLVSMVLVVGYLIPSKNTFLAVVATPSLVESLESKEGKLYKVNKLLNRALDTAEKVLDEVE